MSATAVVVYFWGRRPLGASWALVAAALSVAVPGLAYSGLVMTEALFRIRDRACARSAVGDARAPVARPAGALAGSIGLALATHVRAGGSRSGSLPRRRAAVLVRRGREPATRQAGCSPPPRPRAQTLLAGFAFAGRWSDVFGAYAAAAGGYEVRAALADVFWHPGARSCSLRAFPWSRSR